jgi:hypothetical protein
MAHGGRRKRGEEGRDEGGDVNGAGCAAPPLAATTIHQRVEATTADAPRPTTARTRREVTPKSPL